MKLFLTIEGMRQEAARQELDDAEVCDQLIGKYYPSEEKNGVSNEQKDTLKMLLSPKRESREQVRNLLILFKIYLIFNLEII